MSTLRLALDDVPSDQYELVVTDLHPDRELAVMVGDTAGSAVLDVDSARLLRDYLTGWITAREA